MSGTNTTWEQMADRLEALALKLKLHYEQATDGEVSEAMSKLRQGVHDAFDAVGNVVKDEAVRSDVRDVGQLLADAVSNTLSRVTVDVKETFAKK